jgi:hypothetical protein
MSQLPDPDDRLDSWKEIAAFLRRTVRTVQRWERTAGLPVRRGRPGQRRAIVASKSELREWWSRQQDALQDDDPAGEPTAPSLRRRVVLGGFAVAVVALVVIVSAGRGWSDIDTGPVMLGRVLAAASSEGRAASSVPLGATPEGLVISPDGNRAFVALYDADAVAVVDLVNGRALDRIPVVSRPSPVELSRDGRQLFVGGDSEVGIVDTRTRSLDRVRTGTRVVDIALSSDGRRLWLALDRAGLKILDTRTRQLADYPSVGCPRRLALARRSGRLFVSYQCGGPGGRDGHDALEAIDEPGHRSLLARSGPPLVGSYLAVSPDEQLVWADALDACISAVYDHVGCPAVPALAQHVLRAATLEPLASFALPNTRGDSRPVFVPDGSRVVVGALGLSVLNARLGQVEEHLAVGDVREAGFTPDTRRIVASVADRRALLIMRVHELPDARGFDGLGSYWPGDGAAADIVGGTHAIRTDGLSFAPGRLGHAFAFDERLADVHASTRLDVDILDAASTYTAWIRPARLDRDMTVVSRGSRSGWAMSLRHGGRLSFCIVAAPGRLGCEQGGVVADAGLTGGWHHVAVARDGATMKLYVDAREAAVHQLAGALDGILPARSFPDAITRFGSSWDGSTPFVGLIDELAFFRRALNADDLARVMAATTVDGSKPRS